MSERDGIVSKLLIPEKNRLHGWATRLFLACTLATGITLYVSRNQPVSGINFAKLIDNPDISLKLSADGKNVAYIQTYQDQNQDSYREIKTVDQNGNEKILFVVAGGGYISDLAWDPVGTKLVLNLDYNSDPYWGIHAMPEQPN